MEHQHQLDLSTVLVPLDRIRIDGGTQMREKIDQATVNEYAEVVDALPPITLVFDGVDNWLADGFHRVAAFQQAGHDEIPAIIHHGDQETAIRMACGANAEHGLRRTNNDTKKAIKTAFETWETASDRALAEICKVSPTTIGRYRRMFGFHTPHARRGRDGRTYAVNDEWTGSLLRSQEDEHPEPPVDLESWEEPTDPDGTKVLRPPLGVDGAGSGDEWYTPEAIILMAREVLGQIDLDPASSVKANEIVNAAKYYTIVDDGLTKEWKGRIWLNPPYSNARAFVEKCVEEFEAGNVQHACILVNAKTETQWFQPLWEYTVCFVEGRIKFIDGTTMDTASTGRSASVVAYLGNRRERFHTMFSRFGKVVMCEPGKSTPYALKTHHRNLCVECKKPCSTGKWCETCKQYNRSDRTWKKEIRALAKQAQANGRDIMPMSMRVRCKDPKVPPWWVVAEYLVTEGFLEGREWNPKIADAKRGAE